MIQEVTDIRCVFRKGETPKLKSQSFISKIKIMAQQTPSNKVVCISVLAIIAAMFSPNYVSLCEARVFWIPKTHYPTATNPESTKVTIFIMLVGVLKSRHTSLPLGKVKSS